MASTNIMEKRSQSFLSPVKIHETFFVHNLTNLRPMTALFFRVRSRNINGVSDWSNIKKVITLDTLETKTIIPPESLRYFFDEKKLIIKVFSFYFKILFNLNFFSNLNHQLVQ